MLFVPGIGTTTFQGLMRRDHELLCRLNIGGLGLDRETLGAFGVLIF